MTQKAKFIEEQKRLLNIEVNRFYLNSNHLLLAICDVGESGKETVDVEILDSYGDIRVYKCTKHTIKQMKSMYDLMTSLKAQFSLRLNRYENIK